MCVWLLELCMALIKLHRKADLLEMKIRGTKYRKGHADKISFNLEGIATTVVQAVGWSLWSDRQTIFLQATKLSKSILKHI